LDASPQFDIIIPIVPMVQHVQVGKAMNEFAKRVSNDKPTAANKARQLVAKWKVDTWSEVRGRYLGFVTRGVEWGI